jgi:cytochrome b pre-mRNA-processing protein 3
MLKRLLGLSGRSNRITVDALYGEIVAAARQPAFYADWRVPDTPLGRYEMVALHMFLVLHRLRAETGEPRAVAQELTDEFFKEVEHSIRELGVGDMGVPKRMKKLAGMFYGRTASYDAALQARDGAALAAALARNIRPDAAAWEHAGALAGYVMAACDALATVDGASICRGAFHFPASAARVGEKAA